MSSTTNTLICLMSVSTSITSSSATALPFVFLKLNTKLNFEPVSGLLSE